MQNELKVAPLGLWFLTILVLAFNIKLSLTGYFSIGVGFSFAAAILIFIRHKVAWTVATSWLFITILSTVRYLTTSAVDLPPSQYFIFGLYIFNTVLQVFLLGYYFRFPFLNLRRSMIGSGDRINVDLEGEISGLDVSLPAQIINISVTGVALKIKSTDVLERLPPQVLIRIPGIKGFEMRGRITRRNDDFLSVQFVGLSLSSAREHFKLLIWLRQFQAKSTRLQSDSGFSLMEAMIVCGIGSILVFVTSEIIVDVTRLSQSSKVMYEIYNLRDSITREMRNSQAWQNTIADANNTPLNCIRNETACDPNVDSGLIDLRTQKNILLLSSRRPTAGYTLRGVACDTFDSINGNNDCPIRFTIRSRPICTGICSNPTIELTLSAEMKMYGKEFIINMARYKTMVYRDPLVDSLLKTCRALGGIFNETSGLCNLTLLSSTCSAQGQYLLGISNGVPQCASIPPSPVCPNGEYLKGFDNFGAPVCVAL